MQTYGVNFIGIYLLLYYSVWGIGYTGYTLAMDVQVILTPPYCIFISLMFSI
jgi:hypothetical protein